MDHLIANFRCTAPRIRKYWGYSAIVIHAPVQVESSCWNADRYDLFLCLCRLVPYKPVDLVLDVFNRLCLLLLVVGDGREKPRLEALAAPKVPLLGRLSQPGGRAHDLLQGTQESTEMPLPEQSF